MIVQLSEPIDSLSPPTLTLRSEDPLWRSPAGYFATGLNYMDECGKMHFTLVAYRSAEIIVGGSKAAWARPIRIYWQDPRFFAAAPPDADLDFDPDYGL